ncbi:hypothetical protein K437DRAFT_222675 [Tilletiaria anomala UBC 951]|uniref:PH domain-containing protein n=1 Tax=Tilletiaria anomala (strain ATCC 24038 / CBS 436.72 / UBC 951) TaxID=1037660 RepID=A0A066W3E8_TILAU|nr:uncharacterized protein K437DRAFT_222675 [Tilletiaria anomala UBC 951]KDN48477.1 hypothetical protein K437DRAFT_222675 [Tilletiaria anomala UBC 951]
MTSLIQHKVYLITKQRYVNVNVRSDARARDLVLEAMNNGSVANDDSTLGGWVIFDVSAEFGIERPIREYELVSEVAEHRASQSHDYFLLRRTELAPYVSLRSVPDRSPALAGYVYVQDRKKKWSKRWLELRDHSLFHAKSDSGKDEEHICTLSNFDVYLVTNPRFKGPKAHSFAIRSQDKITMFEKPDQDYLHFFCLSDPAAHRDWVKNILNARTYILRQERATLFRVLTAATVAQTFIGADSAHPGVRRSGSLKHAVTTTTPRPDQTLSSAAVSVSSEGVAEPISALHASSKPLLLNADLLSGPFEKGSLLAEVATRGLMSNSTTRRPAEGDFSMHERTRQRLEESARKAERQQALAAAIAEGRPLLHLSPRQ